MSAFAQFRTVGWPKSIAGTIERDWDVYRFDWIAGISHVPCTLGGRAGLGISYLISLFMTTQADLS
ncbi:MAG: hypothetical protein OEN48_05220 [Betaproteobacteria bacterium]|nr:hypothetical protein [Gammaproteobacteria bacterium]MDH3436374.1 hypothetical protein [Betaproteobacteria bacterium]